MTRPRVRQPASSERQQRTRTRAVNEAAAGRGMGRQRTTPNGRKLMWRIFVRETDIWGDGVTFSENPFL